MPEIWLPYGSVEVAVELREENILRIVEVAVQPVSPEVLKQSATILTGEGGTILVLTDADAVSEILKNADKGWRVTAPKRFQSKVRKWADAAGMRWTPLSLENAKLGGVELPLPSGPRPLAMIGEARFDPLFGVKGPVGELLRLSKDPLRDAVKELEKGPRVGEETEAWKIAQEVSELLADVRTVELVDVGSLIAHVAHGAPADVHREASSSLKRLSTLSLEGDSRIGLVSSGGGRWDATLSDALRALWNSIGGIRSGGNIILLSECADGIGGGALEDFIYGQHSRVSGYSEGLENVILLNWVKERYSVTIVSSLPLYWVEKKLGLKAASSATQALAKAMNPRSRVLVVTRGGNLLLRS